MSEIRSAPVSSVSAALWSETSAMGGVDGGVEGGVARTTGAAREIRVARTMTDAPFFSASSTDAGSGGTGGGGLDARGGGEPARRRFARAKAAAAAAASPECAERVRLCDDGSVLLAVDAAESGASWKGVESVRPRGARSKVDWSAGALLQEGNAHVEAIFSPDVRRKADLSAGLRNSSGEVGEGSGVGNSTGDGRGERGLSCCGLRVAGIMDCG
jgi:hypothetical protein